MRRFLVGLLLLVPVYALALAAPGCGNVCNDLRDTCARCTDQDYRASCFETVDAQQQAVCRAQSATFELVCPETEGGGGGDVAGDGCRDDEVLCGGACVTLSANPSACGDCNTTCAEEQVCGLGACLDACPDSLPDVCEGGCVDVQQDPRNCGACGTVCAEGEVCADGRCAEGCAADSANATQCGDACVDLAQDPLNCGRCGTVCASGEVCSAGACASSCGTGLIQCCGRCVDPDADPDHCHGCDPSCPEVTFDAGDGCALPDDDGATVPEGTPSGRVCAEGQVCNAGCCADDCGSLTECPGGVCVDVTTDANHCGACGQTCAGGVCNEGACSSSGCPSGLTACDGGCFDLVASTAHCGACGNACATGEVCSLGACAPACDAGLSANCGDGGCYDANADPDHCGVTCESCGGDTPKCSNGQCVAACDGGLTDCNGACIDLSTGGTLFHCGGCDNSCADNDACTADACDGGSCVNTSGASLCNDGNPCTVDRCDPQEKCVFEPYTQSEFEALCQQLEGLDPTAGCLWCDPTSTTSGCALATAGQPCTDEPFGSPIEMFDDNACGECDANLSCDMSVSVMGCGAN
ncbi:MAG: hypothetical protein AAF715_14020 [Myxococcota bacterium]